MIKIDEEDIWTFILSLLIIISVIIFGIGFLTYQMDNPPQFELKTLEENMKIDDEDIKIYRLYPPVDVVEVDYVIV